jgi:hypothetical protein
MSESREDIRAARAYERKLRDNPDCRDPDHPGCEFCEERKEQEDEQD